MKAFITKLALGPNIIEVEATPYKEGFAVGKCILYRDETGQECVMCGEGTNWHSDQAAAVARMKAMRSSRIAGLQRQIDALQNTRIKVVRYPGQP